MAKTKPYGVRFDIDLLKMFAEDKIADTPQQALNYLTEFYRTNREKIDFKKMFEESSLFKQDAAEKPKVSFTKKKKENTEDQYTGLSKGEILRKMREQK